MDSFFAIQFIIAICCNGRTSGDKKKIIQLHYGSRPSVKVLSQCHVELNPMLLQYDERGTTTVNGVGTSGGEVSKGWPDRTSDEESTVRLARVISLMTKNDKAIRERKNIEDIKELALNVARGMSLIDEVGNLAVFCGEKPVNVHASLAAGRTQCIVNNIGKGTAGAVAGRSAVVRIGAARATAGWACCG
ncbi:hypothetical protein B0H14DRAFT_2599278 [Mycena olivaceomarginata]|nr:hypothetical protein B0H14DRAFT_2599278 [Mycena olivaceomarginata]